jgi:predicted ribosome quality control (RQC) complex YloA/Tae2 family protein
MGYCLADEHPRTEFVSSQRVDRVARRPQIIRYALLGDWTLLVGRDDSSNELLSLHVAAPDDWWFHAASVPGSHVILCAKDGAKPSRATLRSAAAIAAYYSKAKDAATVRVHCTRARYVRKPPGTKLGTVEISRGTIMKVRPDCGCATRMRSFQPG